jgi:peptide/nickel transport system permease protein
MAETNVDKIPGADAVQASASRASDAGKVSTWTSFRKNKLAFYSLLVVILFVILSILAPLLVPHDPLAQNPADRFESSSGKYWLGTDAFGRDVLSRILIGSQTSLAVGFIAVTISGLVGFSLGMIAAYKGGWLDDILMRITESIMTIPIILLGMLIMVAIGANMTTLIIVICIGFIPSSARMARASTLEVKEKEFIKASISMGGSDLRILLVHILPNIMAPLLVAATLNMSSVIRVEASLSFLGMGIQPPHPTWGNMIQEGFAFITTHPWLTLSPGIALMILSIAFNLVGDGLRDAIDPHIKHQQR